jgi:hypothetical protein
MSHRGFGTAYGQLSSGFFTDDETNFVAGYSIQRAVDSGKIDHRVEKSNIFIRVEHGQPAAARVRSTGGHTLCR